MISPSAPRDKRLDQEGGENQTQKDDDGLDEKSELVGHTQAWRREHFKGWRSGVLIAASSSLIVFIINLSTTIWGLAHAGVGVNGTVSLYDGSCTQTHKLNIGIHLMLNILSTVLLSGSNYCMQCLSAPTRREVDKAHAMNQWLDIGVFSVRNLKSISRKRVILWCCLCISSLPLHLFYNAAVFSSISANEYFVFFVRENFLQSNNVTLERGPESYGTLNSTILLLANQIHANAISNQVAKLNNVACINAYAQPLQSARGNVIVVLDDGEDSNAIIDVWYESIPQAVDDNQDPFRWICAGVAAMASGDQCVLHVAALRANPTAWIIPGFLTNKTASEGAPVKYCLSESVPEPCNLQISLGLAVFVTCTTLFKAVVMCFIAFGIKERPLMTIGDAISSFMERPDHFTDNMCLLSKAKAGKNSKQWSTKPKFYKEKRRRWLNASSSRRWILCVFLYFMSLSVCGILYSRGLTVSGTASNVKTLWNLSFGAVNATFFILWRSGLDNSWIGNTLMANIAQPIFSFIYFTYNGLFTTMLLADEWSHFAHQRKGLRVSGSPIGSQRSTYFLSLPYRFALPLLAVSGLLHWLVSQSLFFVSVKAYGYDAVLNSTAIPTRTRQHSEDFVTTGYSPIAILTVIIVGALVVFIALVTSFQKFKSGMPVAGSCSAAISAACHSNHIEDEHASLLPLQWGVSANANGIGHCTFSSKEVDPPDEYTRYAGFKANGSLHRRS